MQRDITSVLDMLVAAQLAIEFVAGYTFEQFMHDIKTQDAVIRRIEIIGEASRRLSTQFKTDHPEIPWSKMQGMRNTLIHEYDEVVMETVWEVVTIDLIELIAQLESLVPPPDEGDDTTGGPSV